MATKYDKIITFYQIVRSDGEILNYSWPTRERAEIDLASGRYADKLSDGQTASIVEQTRVSSPSKFELVILEGIETAKEKGIYQEGDENLLSLEATCFMHMAYDAGRPSDAARSTVRSYLMDPERFRSHR